MANQLEQVNKEIVKIDSSIDGLISKLKGINDQMINISKNAREVSSSIGNVTSPKGLDESINKSVKGNEVLSQIIKEREATERKLISTIAKKALTQERATKQLTKENEELKILRREQRNQVKAVSDLSNAYDKLQAQTNILQKRYNDLSVRQQKTNDLTEKETRRLEKLGEVINKNRGILSKTDAETGRYFRNVGNYTSGFNGLNVAIARIAQEGPAAAVSLNTFFLGISNNFAALQDEIIKLTAANRELVAQGKPTESIFKKLAASLISPQVLLAGLVTVFTLYNKQIIEFISNAINGGAKVRDLAKNQKILNEAYKEAAKSAAGEISQLQLLLAVASDKTKSDQTRKKAVDKLIDSSGGLIKEQDRLNILNGKAVEIENKLVKAILNKAIIQQLQTKISEDINKLLDKKLELQELEIQKSKLLEEGLKNVKDANVDLTEEESKGLTQKEKLLASFDKLSKVNKRDLQLQGEGLVKQQEANKLGDKANKLNQETTVIQQNINRLIAEALRLTDDYTLSLDNNTKATSRNNVKNRDRALLLSELSTEVKKSTDDLGKGFDNLNEDVSLSGEEIEKSLERINKVFADEAVKSLDLELLNESFDELSETIQFFTGANGQVFSDFFRKITSEGIKSFEDIADVAESTFDVIGEIANAYYNASIEKYEADIDANNLYYENLLDNATLTDDERTRLEEDRARKEEEIRQKQRREQVKQAQFERAIQVAQIITNTAKAVVAALPNIPLSIAVGAIGAAQLGIALGTPIPQFKDGHLSGTHEGLAIINDASGGNYQEVVQRKDGTLEMYKDRNQLINMQRGDKVFKAGTHGAEDYLKGISDKELMKDVNKHSFIASLQHQNYMIAKLENAKSMNNDKLNTDRIVKAINSKKTKFNLNQSINIGEDLNFLKRLDF